MDDDKLDIIAENIFIICDVKVRSPVMSQSLKKYIAELGKDISEGKL